MQKHVFTLLLLVLSCALSAQNSSDFKVKKAIEIFFEGFHKGDTLLMKSVMMDKFITQTAFKNKEGKDILVTEDSSKLINAIAKRPTDQKWVETLLDYNIQIDGNMANVWTPYEFWLNDEFSHCGVNSFQMFNKNGEWKIIYLIDTRRRQDCNK